jgi:hypothetical protein
LKVSVDDQFGNFARCHFLFLSIWIGSLKSGRE